MNGIIPFFVLYDTSNVWGRKNGIPRPWGERNEFRSTDVGLASPGNSHRPFIVFVEGDCDGERRLFSQRCLIIADDMGWTDYGFMGHPHIPRRGSTGCRHKVWLFNVVM